VIQGSSGNFYKDETEARGQADGLASGQMTLDSGIKVKPGQDADYGILLTAEGYKRGYGHVKLEVIENDGRLVMPESVGERLTAECRVVPPSAFLGPFTVEPVWSYGVDAGTGEGLTGKLTGTRKGKASAKYRVTDAHGRSVVLSGDTQVVENAMFASNEPTDIHSRGFSRWQGTVNMFVAKIPGCLGMEFRNWARAELMKLGHDKERQKYIGGLSLAELEKDRQGVFAHTGGFWADEWAKHPWDKCRAQWIENMRDAGFITYPKAWQALNRMWNNSNFGGTYPGPRTRADAEAAEKRRKAAYANAEVVDLAPVAPSAPSSPSVQSAPARPAVQGKAFDKAAYRREMIQRGRTYLKVVTDIMEREIGYGCDGYVKGILNQINARTSDDDLFQLGEWDKKEIGHQQAQFRDTLAKGVVEKLWARIMNTPYSQCNDRWVWEFTAHNYDIKRWGLPDMRSAYTGKRRREKR
jgi:hypothetical protein